MEKDSQAALGLLLFRRGHRSHLYPLCPSGFMASLKKHVLRGEASGPARAAPR